eukprot:6962494-Alexandrium_andersonii.AAC.1
MPKANVAPQHRKKQHIIHKHPKGFSHHPMGSPREAPPARAGTRGPGLLERLRNERFRRVRYELFRRQDPKSQRARK